MRHVLVRQWSCRCALMLGGCGSCTKQDTLSLGFLGAVCCVTKLGVDNVDELILHATSANSRPTDGASKIEKIKFGTYMWKSKKCINNIFCLFIHHAE